MRRLVPLFLFICLSVSAQKKTVLNELAAEFTHKSLPLLKEVLSIPNDAISAEWIEENIFWTEGA